MSGICRSNDRHDSKWGVQCSRLGVPVDTAKADPNQCAIVPWRGMAAFCGIDGMNGGYEVLEGARWRHPDGACAGRALAIYPAVWSRL